MQDVRSVNDDKKIWSRQETTRLIQIYENSPELWNTKHRDYGERGRKNATLLKMAQHFETSSVEIQRKLHNLRNQLRQEMQKIKRKRSETGTDDAYKSNWPHFKALQFILPAIFARQAAANVINNMVSYRDKLFHLYSLQQMKERALELGAREVSDGVIAAQARSLRTFGADELRSLLSSLLVQEEWNCFRLVEVLLETTSAEKYILC